MKPTIKDEDLIRDPMDDEAGKLVKEMNRHTTLTKEWVRLKQEIIKCMSRSRKKVIFESDNRLFQATRVGDTVVCKVPGNKRGYLEKLRGHTIRLVCIGSYGRHLCDFIAAPLDSPSLNKKLKK